MRLWKKILLSSVIGLAIGVLTVLGQGVLPGSWNWLANQGTVWLIPAFFAGALGSKKFQSAMLGIISLIGMVTGYYLYAMLIQNVPHSIYFILVWTGAAVVGGFIFGIAGFLWGKDHSSKHKFGSALIGGIFIAEGADKFIHIESYRHILDVATVQIIVGFTLVLLLERTAKNRIASLYMLIPVVILCLIGYQSLHLIT